MATKKEFKLRRVKIDTSHDYEKRTSRKQVSLVYDFNGKLAALGKMFYEVTCYIDTMGGCVLGISFPTPGEIRTMNDDPDNMNPHGQWRASYVHFRVVAKSPEHEREWNVFLDQLIAG